jgi:hypothetical protein
MTTMPPTSHPDAERNEVMKRVAHPTPPRKAGRSFYAHLHDDSGILAMHNGQVLFFSYDGPITPISSDAGLVVLGEASLADTQILLERLHGGRAWIVTHRAQEVA